MENPPATAGEPPQQYNSYAGIIRIRCKGLKHFAASSQPSSLSTPISVSFLSIPLWKENVNIFTKKQAKNRKRWNKLSVAKPVWQWYNNRKRLLYFDGRLLAANTVARQPQIKVFLKK